ncbi:carboxyltransferase domain-containing protein, partial [Francisella tularensis]|uniref:carboxyltransferase domain-containing protein n=1 Tax=Francisella tularensis TaxID=263 RepID=UPI0023AB5BDE|nr:allophanate hydrolase subunit 1 [Francisella tularensis subsp. holarctica]
KYAIYDIVPAYNSIAFHFDYQYIYDGERAILAKIRNLNLSTSVESKIHQNDVSYTGLYLHNEDENLGLDFKEIIKRHNQ